MSSMSTFWSTKWFRLASSAISKKTLDVADELVVVIVVVIVVVFAVVVVVVVLSGNKKLLFLKIKLIFLSK